jgi:hypothetical protein
MLSTTFSSRSWLSRAAVAGVAALSLGAATLSTIEPAQAQHFGHFGGGRMFMPHGGYGGGFRGGYGGGWHRGGYGRGFGYGLGGLGLGLALGSGLGYGYGGYGPGYYGAYYGGYGYGYGGGCLRRVWGPYGPHWVNVCY